MADRSNGTSGHILGTSANLLGFCLFVITSLHISGREESHLINLLTSLLAILLAFSSVFSFASLRSTLPHRSIWLEKVADYFFIVSLLVIVVVIGLITFNLIR